MILPGTAFIGGGGEIAYWLELKDLFVHYKVPYPVLVTRNSFMIIEKKVGQFFRKLNIETADLFKSQQVLLNEIVSRETNHRLALDEEKSQVEKAYASIKMTVKEIDSTLQQHVESLETKTIKKLVALEKKMLRAEKLKFQARQRQLSKLFSVLFPEGNLQERSENFMLYYAKWGECFFEMLYDNSLSLEQKFCVVEENQQLS
jgi:bacillithiol synthase